MNFIEVYLDASIRPTEDVDSSSARVPELVAEWTELLTEAESLGQSELILPSLKLSDKNSKNFQVIGMLYKVICGFHKEHELPALIRIACADQKTATMYRQIYNFYVPRTKEERMDDSSWD